MDKVLLTEFVRVISIRRADGTDYDCEDSRLDHLGECGRLVVHETSDAASGRQWAYVDCIVRVGGHEDWCDVRPSLYLRTGFGDVARSGSGTVIATRDSVYTFEDLEGSLRRTYIEACKAFASDFEERASRLV